MKSLPLLLLSILFVSAQCFASDDDFKTWKQRASGIKMGTPLEEVERLIPVYWGLKHTIIFDSISVSVPDNRAIYTPTTISAGLTSITTYYVSLETFVSIGFNSSTPDNPVSSVTVEHQSPEWDKIWQDALRINVNKPFLIFVASNLGTVVPESVSQVLENVSPDKLMAFFDVLRNESAISVSKSVTISRLPADNQTLDQNLQLWTLIVKQHLHGRPTKQPDGTVMITYDTHYPE